MNRKLQRTVMALSATATVFTVLLLAGVPAVRPAAQPGPMILVSAAVGAGFDAAATAVPADDAEARRHLRRSRAALALPYFSFAQGLRRGRS